MSHIVSASAPITSAHTVKLYVGFGILGADIPTTGDNGGSPVINDSPVSTSEYHWRLETAPSSGTVTIYPDLAFTHTGAADGTWTWQYRLFEDGISVGVATITDVLGAAISLLISNSLHAHAADNLSLSLDTFLSAQDASHAHSSENLTLDASTAISLILSEAFHGLSSDVISFITGSYLQVADALHEHSADSLTLATASFLAVANALHSHAADNLTLDTSNATTLAPQDSAHAHSVDNTALTLDTWLAIVEAIHAQSADNVSIGSEELLYVADALHSHASDALLLSIPSAPGTCPTAAEIAAAVLAAAAITPINSTGPIKRWDGTAWV